MPLPVDRAALPVLTGTHVGPEVAPAPATPAVPTADASARVRAGLAYEAPSLVEVGTLRDLTAAGSFGDPT